MARALSSEKRQAIITTATRLFGQNGFGATSVADIAREADLPVGSIYTYFAGKDELIRSIVDEGWDNLRERLLESLAQVHTPEEKFRLLLDTFLPELLADVDFISILLSEGVGFTKLEQKTQELSSIIGSIMAPLAGESTIVKNYSPKDMEAALLVYFLGLLSAVRVSRDAKLSVTPEDVLAFLRLSIRNGMGLSV